MPLPHRLTVLITCKNEYKNIRKCIESIQPIADEILVADSGSTDGTLDLVRSIGGCRIIEREYISAGNFKNWALPHATCPWVLIIDADERLPEPLQKEICETLSHELPSHDGYWIYRANYFMGHRIRYSGWNNDCVLRLFRRDLGSYQGETDHAEVAISTGNVGRLRHRMTHYTYWTYDQMLAKYDRYTTHQAELWHQQGRRPSLMKLLFTWPIRFLQCYLIRGGFLDGLPGLQVSALTGYYSFMKQARLWELCCHRKQSDFEASNPTSRPSSLRRNQTHQTKQRSRVSQGKTIPFMPRESEAFPCWLPCRFGWD